MSRQRSTAQNSRHRDENRPKQTHPQDDSVATSPSAADRNAPEPLSRPQLGSSLLTQRPFFSNTNATLPQVRLRSHRNHPHVFRKMVESAPRRIDPGALVQVLGTEGNPIGFGFYNPLAEIAVRMLSMGVTPPSEGLLDRRLDLAVALRQKFLQLDNSTDAYRLIHAESDGLSGLVIDRFGDVLSAEAFGLAMYQRAQDVLSRLASRLGTAHWVLQSPAKTHGQEGFVGEIQTSANAPKQVTIQEFGTRFQVDFGTGHKTGFFCDQRDNRRKLTQWTQGKSVLDVCSYTGGFAIQAAVRGGATQVTAIDLDEAALETARQNAKLNRADIRFVHVDAFQYLRDLIANGVRYDVVVLDPPKLIRNRAEIDAGTRKHLDLNRLAMQVVSDGGLLVTCSCSGLLTDAEFLKLLQTAARQAGTGRTIQFLERTGAAADHPVLGGVPETNYLQAAWMRVLDE